MHSHTHISLLHDRLKCLQAILTGMRWDRLHAYCNWVGVTSPAPQLKCKWDCCLLNSPPFIHGSYQTMKQYYKNTNQFGNLLINCLGLLWTW
jgi:hypothetical protein